jgi:hypothetical protein
MRPNVAASQASIKSRSYLLPSATDAYFSNVYFRMNKRAIVHTLRDAERLLVGRTPELLQLRFVPGVLLHWSIWVQLI